MQDNPLPHGPQPPSYSSVGQSSYCTPSLSAQRDKRLSLLLHNFWGVGQTGWSVYGPFRCLLFSKRFSPTRARFHNPPKVHHLPRGFCCQVKKKKKDILRTRRGTQDRTGLKTLSGVATLAPQRVLQHQQGRSLKLECDPHPNTKRKKTKTKTLSEKILGFLWAERSHPTYLVE